MEVVYFPLAGRAEQVRLLLHDANVAFKDTRIPFPEFAARRAKGIAEIPFGSVPVLHDGDFVLAQTGAIMSYLGQKLGYAPADAQVNARALAITLFCEDIASAWVTAVFSPDKEAAMRAFSEKLNSRFLPTLCAHLEANGGQVFAGSGGVTYADFSVLGIMDAALGSVPGVDLSAGGAFPTLHAFKQRMDARPSIAAYRATQAQAKAAA